MKYDIVNAIECELGIHLSDSAKLDLPMLSGSKIDLIDGLKLDVDGTRSLKDEYTAKPLLFSSKSGKKYVALLSKFDTSHIDFYEISEDAPYLGAENYYEYGAAHNRFLVKFGSWYYKKISFVDGKNVISVSSKDRYHYTVDIYANTADITETTETAGLIPDDTFSFSYFINHSGQGELVYDDSKEKLCTLFPVMGDKNPLYIMWRIGRAVNSLYTQSYEEENSKQLTRSNEEKNI